MSIDFYDPDGYYFNKSGYDEFGGRYDKNGFYHPGEGNKHDFKDLYEEDYYEEDELARQFEAGNHDDEVHDELQERLYREFKKKEKHLYEDEEEEDNHYEVEEDFARPFIG